MSYVCLGGNGKAGRVEGLSLVESGEVGPFSSSFVVPEETGQGHVDESAGRDYGAESELRQFPSGVNGGRGRLGFGLVDGGCDDSVVELLLGKIGHVGRRGGMEGEEGEGSAGEGSEAQLGG